MLDFAMVNISHEYCVKIESVLYVKFAQRNKHNAMRDIMCCCFRCKCLSEKRLSLAANGMLANENPLALRFLYNKFIGNRKETKRGRCGDIVQNTINWAPILHIWKETE